MQTPEGYAYGAMRTKQKERYIAAVVSVTALCTALHCLLGAAVSHSAAPARHAHSPPLPCHNNATQVTPANPYLLHGLVDEDADLPIDAAPPLLALVPQARRARPV